MLTTNIFLGEPPANIKKWIIEHTPTAWDTIVEKLENFDTTKTIAAQKLPEVGSGITTKYIVCDGYNDGSQFVQCLTKQSVMDNLSKIAAIDTPWIVLGYNATVPKYIKYKNGTERIYVASIDDSIADFGLLRPIVAGCKVYIRSWSESSLCNVFTDTGSVVASVGTGTFTYGQTNSDWGTTATAAGGYSAPAEIVVNGKTYQFCGYTMTMQTQHLLCSSKDGATVTESTCAYSYSTSTTSGKNRWGDSYMRAFINSKVGHNEIAYPTRVTPTSNMLAYSNSLGLKLAKDTDFLKHCAPTVRRNFVHSSWQSDADIAGKLDANNCEHTANDFFLLTNAAVNCMDVYNNNKYVHGNDFEEFAIFSSVYKENTAYNVISTYRLKYTFADINGMPSASAAIWTLTSSYVDSAGYVATVNASGSVGYSYACIAYGLSPACTIY